MRNTKTHVKLVITEPIAKENYINYLKYSVGVPVCNNCGKCYEIKSKCLSCERLPEKLYLTHGNYDYYLDRQEEVLDFFILIYKVNRQTKEIIIRKVFHVSDNDIRNYNNFIIKPDDDNYHCNIIINNHNLFQENKKVKNYKISMVNEINTLFKDIYSN